MFGFSTRRAALLAAVLITLLRPTIGLACWNAPNVWNAQVETWYAGRDAYNMAYELINYQIPRPGHTGEKWNMYNELAVTVSDLRGAFINEQWITCGGDINLPLDELTDNPVTAYWIVENSRGHIGNADYWLAVALSHGDIYGIKQNARNLVDDAGVHAWNAHYWISAILGISP